MKVLFILKDNFPDSGACTSLLNNMFFNGGLLRELESISVLSVKDKFVSSKILIHNGITIHNLVMMSRISVEQYKSLFLKHPIMALKGMAGKVRSKLATDAINNENALNIEREINKINAEGFDVIVAVMGYFEVALAAMEYKKRNPMVKLVIYQVDPCSTNESYSASTREEREKFEKELYEVSDAIITTPILLEESKLIYSDEIISKMVPMEFPNVVPKKCNDVDNVGEIRCIFTGNIYGDIRDPKYTWRLFDKVDSRICFKMIGSMSPKFAEESNQHKVNCKGPKSLAETQNELANSDILVNIGNRMLNQVPSKLFEYISYGKPIINICKNRNCPTLKYLSNYPFVLNLFEEEEIFEEQAKKLNDFILDNYMNSLSSDRIMGIYEACTPQYCAKQMLDVFRKLG